jgi:hypothetical protein
MESYNESLRQYQTASPLDLKQFIVETGDDYNLNQIMSTVRAVG